MLTSRFAPSPTGQLHLGHAYSAALAHEAEHVRRGDFWWWQVANLSRIVFWFHPLAWWLRRELRIGRKGRPELHRGFLGTSGLEFAQPLGKRPSRLP